MNCEKCGKPTEGEQTLCPECAAQTPDFQVNLPEEEVTPVAETPVVETPVEEIPVEETPAEDTPAPKKAKKAGLIIGIAVAAVAVLAAIFVFLNWDNFLSPADYIVKVEEAALYDLVDELTDSYGLFVEKMQITTADTKLTMDLDVGEKALALLNASTATEDGQIDFSFLKDIQLQAQTSARDGNGRNLISLLLGENTLLTADYIVVDDQVYLALPEASPAYLQLTAPQETGPVDMTALPDAQELNKTLREYIPAFLAMLQNVEKETVVLALDGAEQSVTALTATVTAEEFSNTFITLLKKLQGDQNAKNLLLAFARFTAAVAEGDPAQQLEEAISGILSDMEQAQSEIEDGDYLTYTTYVDKKSNVVGREMTVYYADPQEEAQTIRYITVTADDITHYSLSTNEGTVFDGQGSNGNGTYHFYAEEAESFTLTVSDWKRTDDTLKGTLILTPKTEESDTDSIYTLLGGEPAMKLTLDLTDSKNDFSFAMLAGTETIAGIVCHAEPGEALEVTVPEETLDAENLEDMNTYAASMDLDKVLTNMEQAGVPTEVVQILAYYLYSILYSFSG